MIRVFFLVLLYTGLLPVLSYAQADIHFSQFYEISTLRNPALIGVSSGNYKIAAFYRSQWGSITNPYETILLNTEYRFALSGSSDDYLSFGVLGFSDKAGDIDQKISAFYPAINLNKSLSSKNNSYLSFGFTWGYLQYGFDPSKATFNNQFQNGNFNASNPTMENLPDPKFTVYDVGLGINYNFTPGTADQATYMVGVSGYHFSQPAFSYYLIHRNTENIRWNANAGMIRDLNASFMLQIHVNYANQGTYNELMTGALLGWKTFAVNDDPAFELFAGAMFRLNDAIIPALKLKYKNLSVGASYDINLSSLAPASNMQGGYEMTLSLSGNFPQNPGGYKKTVCPRF
jgi:type IX secretion system PorP/SprF family membrane protein